MIRILFTAAEEEEIICARRAFQLYETRLRGKAEFDFMLTGIGTTSACYRLTRKLLEAKYSGKPYDLAVNIGIAGSYDMARFPMGTVALIRDEYFGDLGFETLFGFQTLFQYEILDADVFPFRNGALRRPELPSRWEMAVSRYPEATGVTVQTVTGNPGKTAEMEQRFHPQIESMEGAAVYYVCLLEQVPCFELRSVSNAVGERDKAKWNIPLALEGLTQACKEWMSAFAEEPQQTKSPEQGKRV